MSGRGAAADLPARGAHRRDAARRRAPERGRSAAPGHLRGLQPRGGTGRALPRAPGGRGGGRDGRGARTRRPSPARLAGSCALGPAAMLAGAAAAGLLLAAVVGLRLTPPAGEAAALGSAATAEDGLAAMDLACVPVDGGADLRVAGAGPRPPRAPHRAGRRRRRRGGGDHRHARVGPIDLRGADDLLRRMTVAVARGSARGRARRPGWPPPTPTCVGTCSARRRGMRLVLEKRDDAVILTVEAR